MSLGQRLLSIEHIGSTSVPSLPSKNIVDILGGVVDREAAEKCLCLLQDAGYDDVTQEDHPEWFYCTTFRDWLRAHPEDAQAYAKLKMTLADKHRNERFLYTEAKAGFITLVLEKMNILQHIAPQQ